MRIIITILVYLSLTVNSFSQSQMEMNQSASNNYLKADRELNRVYKQILTDYKNDSTFIKKLKVSQRLWIRFRDAELEMKYPEEDKRLHYGSVITMCELGELTELTTQRTIKLKNWLEWNLEGDVCSGSIMWRESNKN